eukprot:Tamp_16920.p1 GENE.Tamp_16920~~Tamp_16920.p1  ORF type:complete len:467 (-),score=60.03 Tamp_16920:26-1393(-)
MESEADLAQRLIQRLPIEEAEECLCQLDEQCITVGVLRDAEAQDLADELGFTERQCDAVFLADVAWRAKYGPEEAIQEQQSWFAELFGFREGSNFAENRAAFQLTPDRFLLCKSAPAQSARMYVGPFETPTLAELRERYPCRGSAHEAPQGGLLFQHLPGPGGVSSLIADPDNAGAVFQAASQFNCLEMVSPAVSPEQGITGYIDDRTQGPQCALACPAALVFRNYLCGEHGQGQGGDEGEQIDCLADVGHVLGNDGGCIWRMRNGYALPSSAGSMRDLARRLDRDPALVCRAEDALRVGVHWDTSVRPPATHRVAQVLASALPVAYSNTDSADWQNLASLVLRAAYRCVHTGSEWKHPKQQVFSYDRMYLFNIECARLLLFNTGPLWLLVPACRSSREGAESKCSSQPWAAALSETGRNGSVTPSPPPSLRTTRRPSTCSWYTMGRVSPVSMQA